MGRRKRRRERGADYSTGARRLLGDVESWLIGAEGKTRSLICGKREGRNQGSPVVDTFTYSKVTGRACRLVSASLLFGGLGWKRGQKGGVNG